MPKPRWTSVVRSTLSTTNFPELGPGECFTIRENGWDYDCLFVPRDSDRLVVMLSGAVDRTKIALPAFARTAHGELLNARLLCISDPTLRLNDELAIGWYVGTHERDATEGVANIVRHAFDILAPGQRPVIFGSSAGGFAALQVACRLVEASAVALNPQVVVSRYFTRATEALKISFGADIGEPAFKFRNDAAARFANTKCARAILVQNNQDTHHKQLHAGYLQSLLEPQDEHRFRLFTFESDMGHSFENRGLTARIASEYWPFIAH